MASRKTDFNTEDIMGSILGMPTAPVKKEEEAQGEDQKTEWTEKASEPMDQVKTEKKVEGSGADKAKERTPSPLQEDREYIPIETIRLHRRDERDMKVPVSFSLSRLMAEQLKQIAYVDRVSSSEIVTSLIQAFINNHQEELREYQRLSDHRKR